MRNKENIEAFKDKTENAPELLKYFETNEPVRVQGKRWFKDVKNKIHKTFEKVRINTRRNKLKTDMDLKLEKRTGIQQQISIENDLREKFILEDALDEINEEISKDCAEGHIKNLLHKLDI